MTDRWTDKPNFTVFLSNAATLTSLVLGLVAIFYSIVSNVDFSKSLGNISRVNDEIAQAKEAIGELLNESKSILNSGSLNTSQLRNVSNEIATSIENLEVTLKALQAENSQLRDAIVPIPGHIEALALRLGESNPPPQSSAAGGTDQVTPAGEAKKLARRTSLHGILALYAVSLAKKNSKSLDLESVGKITGAQPTYLHGFVVALHSLGAITNKPVEGRPRTGTIFKAEAYIEAFTKEMAIEEINNRKTVAAVKWLDFLDAIDRLFEPTDD